MEERINKREKRGKQVQGEGKENQLAQRSSRLLSKEENR